MSSSIVCASLFALVAFAMAEIPFDQQQNGKMSFYDNVGGGACGSNIDAANEELVAVSKDWFSNPNPNLDELCQGGVCVSIEYEGKTVQAPVKDKCMGCDKGHVDLSKPVFSKLASVDKGILEGVNWKFVKC